MSYPDHRGRAQPTEKQDAAVWVRPALGRIIHRILAPHLRDGTTVLEVGAGTGELSVLIEDALPPGIHWMCTDQNPLHPGQTVGTLPDLPEVSDASADVIAELSVADAISRPVLVNSFGGMWRVLKPGGTIVRILDLREQSGILGPDAAGQGYIPLLYNDVSIGSPNFSRRLVFLDRERLRTQIPALRQGILSSITVDKIESWLNIREGVLEDSDPPWQRDSLLAQFRRFKILAAEMDLAAYAESRLREALTEANTRGPRFEVEFCGAATEETVVKRETLKGLPKKVAAVASRYGLIRLWESDPFGPHSHKFVRIRSTAIVLVARKTSFKNN